MPTIPVRPAVAALLAATALCTAGCSQGSTDPAEAPPVLVTQPDFQPGATPACLMHQTEQPNTAYEGGTTSQTVPQLTFLAYYTAAGKKPFCDGAAATDTDKKWAQLYVKLTDNPANVTTVLP